MNLNSLIIVADSSRARLFRTAQSPDDAGPIELIELGNIEASEIRGKSSHPENGSPHDRATALAAHSAFDKKLFEPDGRLRFAHEVAQRAAEFARHHVCSPVIVAANEAVLAILLAELERELPDVYVRVICEDLCNLSPGALMLDLKKRDVFSATHSAGRA